MLHIVDIDISDEASLARLAALIQPEDVLLLTGASLQWPDNHSLAALCESRRLDDQITDGELAALMLDCGPVLSHCSDQEKAHHD